MSELRAPVNTIASLDEIIPFLGEYFYKCLKGVHTKIRLNMMEKFDTAARNNFTSWHNLIPGTSDNFIAGRKCNNRLLTDNCNLAYQNISALLCKKLSLDNLNRRVEILSVILGVDKDQFKKYITPSPVSFNLLACLYDLIFVNDLFRKNKKEILLYFSNYSDKYPQLSFSEILNKLNITDAAFYDSLEVLELRLTLFISKFKLILPYNNFDPACILNQDFFKISPDMCRLIKSMGSVKYATTRFIVKELSVLYNYEIIPVSNKGVESYYLIKPGLANKNHLISFFNKLQNDIESFNLTFCNSALVGFLETYLHNEFPHKKVNKL